MRFLSIGAGLALAGCGVTVHVEGDSVRAAAVSDPADWRQAEQSMLANHVQLTFSDRFIKAGEAYFSPDGSRIIFQAVEKPPEGEPPSELYAMYVADLARRSDGRITGLDHVRRISPRGSANTCGWFHPTEPGVVIFATTVDPPSASHPPGYQRTSGRYRWMFPPEMRIVRCDLDEADGTADSLEVIVDDPEAYAAEGALSPDGRHVVYCSLESSEGDLFVKDLVLGRVARVVGAHGYDGGPFFSPGGRRICYRSDRHGDHLLQLFVADLAFNEEGAVVGIEREFQLTDDENVNWCPFWHPGGRHLIYATSEIGHHNYEVFLIDADPGTRPGSTGSIKYGTRKRRITHFSGSDVLPVFNADGSKMMWTSRRGEDGSIQLWVADFVMKLDKGKARGNRQ
ncbi:MAG: TolB family protein [Planctomycetota bacterium]|jgi:Tol biopolymer transport system component